MLRYEPTAAGLKGVNASSVPCSTQQTIYDRIGKNFFQPGHASLISLAKFSSVYYDLLPNGIVEIGQKIFSILNVVVVIVVVIVVVVVVRASSRGRMIYFPPGKKALIM